MFQKPYTERERGGEKWTDCEEDALYAKKVLLRRGNQSIKHARNLVRGHEPDTDVNVVSIRWPER